MLHPPPPHPHPPHPHLPPHTQPRMLLPLAAQPRVPRSTSPLRCPLPLQAEQVEAWEALPAGLKSEVGSPHCFLCQAPQRLVVPQQMRGQHKLFDLEKKVL